MEEKPWSKMDLQEKADAFDASHENPTEYVWENFPNGAPGPVFLPPHGPRHAKPDNDG